MNAVYTNANFQNVILTLLALVVILIIVGCLYTFVRAIILFVFAHNKDDNKKKWWNSIRFMIIGVILTIFLLLLVPTILRWMKVPSYDMYTPSNIFGRAGELVNQLFDLWDIIKQSQQNSQYRGDIYYELDNSSQMEPLSTDTYNL